jgi:predicted site-specific integrase-resolvase
MKFLNEKQVAEILGISVKTLQRWRLFGEGPEWRRFGTAIRYPSDGLHVYIESAPRGGGSQIRLTENK